MLWSKNKTSPEPDREIDNNSGEVIHLTDLFLVAFLEMKGHRVEPLIDKNNGPFENMISFNVYGDVRPNIDKYHNPATTISIVEFLKAYKNVRNQMWNMKEVARRNKR